MAGLIQLNPLVEILKDLKLDNKRAFKEVSGLANLSSLKNNYNSFPSAFVVVEEETNKDSNINSIDCDVNISIYIVTSNKSDSRGEQLQQESQELRSLIIDELHGSQPYKNASFIYWQGGKLHDVANLTALTVDNFTIKNYDFLYTEPPQPNKKENKK